MRAIQAQKCADLPRFSLVAGGSPVLMVVIQGDCVLDYLGNRAFVLLCLDAQGIKGVLGQTDCEGGILGSHHFTAPSSAFRVALALAINPRKSLPYTDTPDSA